MGKNMKKPTKKNNTTKRRGTKLGGFQVSKKTTKQNDDNKKTIKQNDDNKKTITTNSTTSYQNISNPIPKSNIKNKTRRQKLEVL